MTMTVTIDNDTAHRYLTEGLAQTLNIDPNTVTIIRITRKRGGGIEAEAAITQTNKETK